MCAAAQGAMLHPCPHDFSALQRRHLRPDPRAGRAAGHGRAPRRSARRGPRPRAGDRRRDRVEPRALPRRPAASWSSPSPTPACSAAWVRRIARSVPRPAWSKREPRSCRSRTARSTRSSRRSSCAPCPTRSPPWPSSGACWRPAGSCCFLEHVRATDARLARRQDRYQRSVEGVRDGCHCNRDTEALLADTFVVRPDRHTWSGNARDRPAARRRDRAPAGVMPVA